MRNSERSRSVLSIAGWRSKSTSSLSAEKNGNRSFSWRNIIRLGGNKDQLTDCIPENSIICEGVWKSEEMQTTWLFGNGSVEISIGNPQQPQQQQQISIPYADVMDLDLAFNDPVDVLQIIYRNIGSCCLSLVLIPDFDKQLDYMRVFSEWTTASCRESSSALASNDHSIDLFETLWTGSNITQDSKENFNILCWVFNRKSFSICQEFGFSTHVKFIHVSDFVFNEKSNWNSRLSTSMQKDKENAPGKGALTIRYAAFLGNDNDLAKVEDYEVVLPEFGTASDFDELCLLWRQELQLQMIEETFGTNPENPDSILYRYTCDKREERKKTVRFSIINDETEFRPRSAMLKRADSMRMFAKNPTPMGKRNKRKSSLRNNSIFLANPTPEETPCTSPLPETIDELKDLVSEIEEYQNVDNEAEIEKNQKFRLDSVHETSDDEKNFHGKQEPSEIMKEMSCQTDGGMHIRQRSYSQPFLTVDGIIKEIKNIEEIENSFAKRRFTDTNHHVNINLMKTQRSLENLKYPEIYVANHSYIEPGQGEMVIRKGDKMRIVKKDKSGWWYALKLNFKDDLQDSRWVVVDEGWIPSNYIKPFSV